VLADGTGTGIQLVELPVLWQLDHHGAHAAVHGQHAAGESVHTRAQLAGSGRHAVLGIDRGEQAAVELRGAIEHLVEPVHHAGGHQQAGLGFAAEGLDSFPQLAAAALEFGQALAQFHVGSGQFVSAGLEAGEF